jgi:dihydroorotate dehydrogenase
VDGLYALGFAGTEVGTVLVHPQPGNPKPRMWTDKTHHVSLNRLGFNSPGMQAVAENLMAQRRPGITGVSLGKNKVTLPESAPQEHADVADCLFDLVDFFVINVASPNTPGLRDLLNPKPLSEIIEAVQNVLKRRGHKPLFVKTTIDLSLENLDLVLKTCIDHKVDGVVDTNTTVDDQLKAKYGWGGQPGGFSGDDPEFRRRANDRMKHITQQTRGTGLRRIGVGGIHDAASAIERLEAGAEALEVITAMRQHWGYVAGPINRGILAELDRRGMKHVSELVGTAAL